MKKITPRRINNWSYVALIVGASSGIVSILLKDTPIGYWLMVTCAVAMVLYLVLFVTAIGFAIHEDEKKKSWADPFKEQKAPMKVEWCTSCGKRKTPWRYQQGFVRETGEPDYQYIIACPSWDPASPLAMVRSKFYDCENLKTTDIAIYHAHDDPTMPDPNCVACVTQMESAGIITARDASERIAALLEKIA